MLEMNSSKVRCDELVEKIQVLPVYIISSTVVYDPATRHRYSGRCVALFAAACDLCLAIMFHILFLTLEPSGSAQSARS